MWASLYSSGSRTSMKAAPPSSASAKVSMSTSGASGWGSEGVLMPTFLRRQPLDSPTGTGPGEPHALRQAVVASLPELDGGRPHPVAAPVAGPRQRRHSGEPFGHRRHGRVQLVT